MSYKKSDRITAQEAEQASDLFCQAHQCPNLWSVECPDRGIHHLCSAHAWIDPKDWPAITDLLLWQQAERARKSAERKQEPYKPPMTVAEKKAILESLRTLVKRMAIQDDPKAWARKLKEREEAGEILSIHQKNCWRAALEQVKEYTE